MLIHCPELTANQIAEWMRNAAARPAATPSGRPVSVEGSMRHHHPGFDFKKAREALNRARTKTDVRTIKPLQRLRRNQGAVNEGLNSAQDFKSYNPFFSSRHDHGSARDLSWRLGAPLSG